MTRKIETEYVLVGEFAHFFNLTHTSTDNNNHVRIAPIIDGWENLPGEEISYTVMERKYELHDDGSRTNYSKGESTFYFAKTDDTDNGSDGWVFDTSKGVNDGWDHTNHAVANIRAGEAGVALNEDGADLNGLSISVSGEVLDASKFVFTAETEAGREFASKLEFVETRTPNGWVGEEVVGYSLSYKIKLKEGESVEEIPHGFTITVHNDGDYVGVFTVSDGVEPETAPVVPVETVVPETVPVETIVPETAPVVPAETIVPETAPVVPAETIVPETAPVVPAETVIPEDAPEKAVVGTSGGDTLDGKWGSTHIYGLGGNDILEDDWGNDHLYGGAGNDQLKDSWGDDHLYGGSGNDILEDSWGNDHLYGGDGNDILKDSWGDDVLYGGAGDDTLTGGSGDDVLYGGAGDDTLTGGRGDDVFVVNPDDAGKDTVTYFSQGRDKIQITTATGQETTLAELLKNTGITITGNTIFNADGDAIMVLDGFSSELTYSDFYVEEVASLGVTRYGTSGTDHFSGGWGDDTLYGYGGDDRLDGGWGNDVIYGGEGEDELDGGRGDDTLYGVGGDNYLTGGLGNDIFVLTQGRDTVEDFKQGEDKIGILEGGDFNFERDVNGKTISYGGGTIEFTWFYAGKLTLDDFVVFNGSDFVPIPESIPTTITLNSDASKIAEANDVVETALTEVILAGDDTTGYTFTTDDVRFAVNNGVLSIVAGSDFDYEAGATIEVTVTAAKADSDTLDATYTLTLIDAIEGTASHDTLYGTNGDDIIYGYDGQDHVSAGGGNDRIYGGDGNDVIFAGSGDDHLDGGNGDDHLNGQEDKDIFVLNFDYTGKDTVFGFEQGIDKIHIKKAHYDQIVKTDGSINIVEGVIKDADDNDVLVLQGFEGTLTKADFSISQQLSHESVINNIGTVDENDEGADIDGLRFTLNDNIGIDDLTLVGVFEGDKAVSDKLKIKDYADGVYGLKLKDGESFDYEQRDYIYLRLEHEGANVDGGTLLIDINDVAEVI